MSVHEELTSFTVQGDSGPVVVPIGIQADPRSGVYLDWTILPIEVETHIPGTNRTYVEVIGYRPARVTWTLDFVDVAHYTQFLALLGATGTLRVLAGYQSLKGPDPVLHLVDGRDYEDLDQVRLAAIGSTPHFVDGSVEADVTFTRAVDPVTRLAAI